MTTGRDGMTTDYLVMLPPATSLDGYTQIDISGRRCDIVGTPNLLHHPWTGADDHWELTARHVQKAGE